MNASDKQKLQLLNKLGTWQAVEDHMRLARLQEFLREITKPEPAIERKIWIRNPNRV